jgi:putative glycosyltransferase (TIGR04372 family)
VSINECREGKTNMESKEMAKVKPANPRPGINRPRWVDFLRRQANDLRDGQWQAVYGKSIKFFKIFLVWLLAPITFPIIVIMRALRPWKLIRFGQLETVTLGSLATNTELYLCECDDGPQAHKPLDIFHHYLQPVANDQLKRMFARQMHISQLVAPIDLLNRWLPGGQAHRAPLPSDRDVRGLMARYPTHLVFTPDEARHGQEALRELGIPEHSPYVCFFARDAAYANTANPSYAKGGWDHHIYRDCDIQTYLPAVEELTRRGYFALRMGYIVKDALRSDNPSIIDYATNSRRTDFLDIYLPSQCRFGLYTASGACSIPMIFRRPIAYTNCISITTGTAYWGPKDLLIFKKLWWTEKHRLMTFREMIDLHEHYRSDTLRQLGIEVVDNTADEISALAVEMDDRLKGTWRTSEDDEEAQQQFRRLFTADECRRWHGQIVARVGAEFLRQNRELMENG